MPVQLPSQNGQFAQASDGSDIVLDIPALSNVLGGSNTRKISAGVTTTGPINRVYLIFGQSNSVGSEPVANFAPSLRAPRTRTYVQTGGITPTWQLLVPGTNNRGGANAAGIDLSLSARLEELYPNDNIYLLHLGWGSTSLWNDWRSSDGFYLQTLKIEAAAAMKVLPTDSVMCGVIWNQGEGDADQGVNAAAYKDNLKRLIVDIRRFLGLHNIPWFASRLDLATAGAVRTAVEQLKTERYAHFDWIDQDGFTKKDGGVHFLADGYTAIGQRNANALAALDYMGVVRRTWPIVTQSFIVHATSNASPNIPPPVRCGIPTEMTLNTKTVSVATPGNMFFDSSWWANGSIQTGLINNVQWPCGSVGDERRQLIQTPVNTGIYIRGQVKYMSYRLLAITGSHTFEGSVNQSFESYD